MKIKKSYIAVLFLLFLVQSSGMYGADNRELKRHKSHQKIYAAAKKHERQWFQKHRVGIRVTVLPAKHRVVRVKGAKYFYHDGVYYKRSKNSYVVVRAPVGIRLSILPRGFISFYVGPRRYFYVNETYYIYDTKRKDYVVVDEPEIEEGEVEIIEEELEPVDDIFVYPSNGQTDEQTDKDRYECHRWAVEQTGFDPSLPNQNPDDRANYIRALTACLEGRGYTVR